jgi:tetratricopeptide (TPR) repeat protein
MLDAGAVTWAPVTLGHRWRPLAAAVGSAGIAAVLIGAMVVADAGAIAYRFGLDRAGNGAWEESATWLSRATQIDRWHPAGPRALAVAAEAAGRSEIARDAAAQATVLNPGDATAWTNLALLCEAGGDHDCARRSSQRATATARYLAPELLNAALVLDRLGETDAADRAFRLSLLTQPATSFVVDWPRRVEIGDGTIPEVTNQSWQLNLLLARHATGEPIEPDRFADPAVRALAHAAIGDRADAESWLSRAIEEHPDEVRTHDIAVILRDAWGEPVEETIEIASTVRGRPFPERDLQVTLPRTVRDVGSFRAYPLDGFVPTAVRLALRPPFPWPLQEILP